MTTQPHHSTVQLAGIVLKLRDDLAITVRQYGDQPVYVIEDDFNSRFYRVGVAEYTFLSLLDGRTTFADALGQTATALQENALTESEAASLCRWLVETGLASTPESRSSARLFDAAERARGKKMRARANPIFVKVPLCNPDDFLRMAAKLLGWLFSWPVVLPWLIVVGGGATSVAMRWQDATTTTSSIISQHNWIWLAATWLLLKLVHEVAHGVACRRYGGGVREAGVMTILFFPLPYVDVTSAWRLESRWQRLVISAAGMYAELFIAGMAAMVWYSTDPGLLHQHAFNVMFTASIVTILFNANPLMRFDGYYMLTDLLEQPNLATHGQSCLLSLGRRWMLGLHGHVTRWPEGRTWLVYCYGVAALAWRVVICVGLIMAADALYFGAGVALAAIALCLWVLLPFAKCMRFLVLGSQTEQPDRRRFALTAGLLTVVVVAVSQLPWYQHVEAPTVVDYDPIMDLRAGEAGFVENVNVRSGQSVREGTVLVVLRNPELQSRRLQMADELRQSQQRGRLFHQRHEISAWQAEVENANSLADRLRQLNERLAQLEICAPVDGIVLDTELESLPGSYIAIGEPVVSLGTGGEKQVLVLVDEDSVNDFEDHADFPVDVHIWGTGDCRHVGTLRRPEPRGSTRIVHPAFAATSGGPLDVRVVANRSNASNGVHDTTFEFTEPQFLTRVDLAADLLAPLQAGRVGFVSYRAHRGTIGEVIQAAVIHWWESRQAALRRNWTR